MAAELGVDAHTVEQVLDKHLRQHLAELAEVEIELR
jgi:demethoxyubiquinone hydroxylase (CLK1/Coq7/Cat5 family)